MIPSANRQDAKESDWPIEGGQNWPSTKEQFDALAYVCDCCLKHVRCRREMPVYTFGGAKPDPSYSWSCVWNPRLVMVAGVTYYGCSSECARILFNIHHQYAMREGKP